MSLSIIVTCLECIAQRLHLPEAQPNMPVQLPAESIWHAPGSACHIYPLQGLSHRLAMRRPFSNKELSAFLEPVDFMKSNHLWLVLLGPLHFPAFRNSFQGTVPPTAGQSFLLAGSSPPNIDGPDSTTIWANCQVGDNSGDLPTSPSLSASLTLCSNCSWVGAHCSISGAGRASGIGVFCASTCISTLVLTCRALLPFPICSIFFVLTMMELRERESQPIRGQSSLTRVSWHPCWISNYHTNCISFTYNRIIEMLTDEWSKYKKILDREDEGLEAEVSTSLFSKFSSKYRILAGVGIITQNPLNFVIFKQCLDPFPCLVWCLQVLILL